MENNPDFLNEELNDENYIQTAPISVPIEKTAQILEQYLFACVVEKNYVVYINLVILFQSFNFNCFVYKN